jgi:hypothetical protein
MKERIGVAITFTNECSIWDGIAVAIHDPVYEDTTYEFYNGIGTVDVVKKYLKDGLEIRSISLFVPKFMTGMEVDYLTDALSDEGITGIPVFYSYPGRQPFANAIIPPNH